MIGRVEKERKKKTGRIKNKRRRKEKSGNTG